MTRTFNATEEKPEKSAEGMYSESLHEQLKISISEQIGQEISNFKDQVANIIAAKDATYQESLIKRTSREIATLSLHLLTKESEVAALKAKETDYLSQIAALEAERDHLRNSINMIFTSSSWKLTAPLRKLVRLLKR